MVHIVLHERRIPTTKKKKHLHFRRILSANHNQAQQNLCKKGQNHSNFGISVSTHHWLIQLTKTSFPFSFCTLSIYGKATWFSHSSTMLLIAFSTFDQFCYSDYKTSRPKNDNLFWRNSCGSLQIVVVSTTRIFEQPSSASSNYPQAGRDDRDDGRSALKCRCTRYDHKRVSGFWSERYWLLLGKWSFGCRRCP